MIGVVLRRCKCCRGVQVLKRCSAEVVQMLSCAKLESVKGCAELESVRVVIEISC